MDSAVHRPLRRLVARIAGTALVVGAVAGGATTASAQGDVLPVPVNQAADAYAWGYSPSTPSYVVTGAYVKNPTGGSTTISRAGTGRYTITFTGMNFARGNVQVAAYGNANVCNVVNWYGATINVACRNPAGAPADSRFSAIYRNASLPAYVWAHSGTTPTYDASSTYSKNPSGRAVTVHRLDVGRYRVVFNGSSIAGGQAHVTAYNSGASCALLSWGGQCRRCAMPRHHRARGHRALAVLDESRRRQPGVRLRPRDAVLRRRARVGVEHVRAADHRDAQRRRRLPSAVPRHVAPCRQRAGDAVRRPHALQHRVVERGFCERALLRGQHVDSDGLPLHGLAPAVTHPLP